MPVPPRSRGSFRRTLTVTFLVLTALGSYAFLQTGRFLAAEDPLLKADAIFVLAGSRMERALEAADLYREGWAPIIVMTHQAPDRGIRALGTRGVSMPWDEDVARDALVRYGIPADVFILPDRVHDNTAQEARTLHEMAENRRWRHIIVVSSKYHLRRAAYAMRRELGDSGISVTMHGSRYDSADPPRWWRNRGDIRTILSEVPKLAAYVLGLGA